MVVMVEAKEAQADQVVKRFVDVDVIAVVLAKHFSGVSSWPAPSVRPTTSATALALERVSVPDPNPRLPEIEITDGLGI
jgi:hypothetical protein